MRTLRARLLLAALLPLAPLLAAGALWLHAAFAAAVGRAHDERLAAALDALVASIEPRPDGSLAARRALAESGFSQVRSGWYWQVSADAEVLRRSRSLWDAELALPAPPADGRVAHVDLRGPDGAPLRAALRTVRHPARAQALQYAVSAPRSGIEAEVATFGRMLATGVAGVLLLAALALALQVRVGLRPLRALQRQLAEVEAGTRARLDAPPVAELAALAAQLNAALEHDRRRAERGRKLAGDLAHALKTPLALLRSDPALAASADARAALQGLDALVQRHLAQASAQARRGHARAPLAALLRELAAMFDKLHAGRGVAIGCDCAEDLVVHCEADDLGELLGNLVDNACRAARSRVRIAASLAGKELRIDIDDDGPGLAASALAALGERGRRFDEQSGAGLGVSISRDIAESAGGRLEFGPGPLGGLRATVWMPGAAPVTG